MASSDAPEPLDPNDSQFPPGVREVLRRAADGCWLKNTEVCDLLVHYRTYGLPVCRTPPSRPAGGSVFLFDRRAVRFFRKDGHSWRKKADGKTVRETHEKLKVGNVDMLNCYYAHGDDSEDIRLQRRCYWLLEADEDIVLVHYLSANQLVGGPRAKGPGSRAAAATSQSTSQEDSEGTQTTSSDGSNIAGRRGGHPALESPFLAKARVANAQSQAAIAAAVSARNHGPYGASSPAPRPESAQRRAQQDAQQMPPPPAQSALSNRPAAIAAAAAAHPSYSNNNSSLSKNSTLIEGHMPLLPSMSLDSFMNFMDGGPHAGAPASEGLPGVPGSSGKMTRQGSDPLRLESLANQWDEEGAIQLMHGHLPSLHMNPSLQSNSIAMLDSKELAEALEPSPAGLPAPSLRLPSGADGYANFLRGNAAAMGGNTLGQRQAGLKTLSGVIPRMQVVTNSDRSSMDFQTNRSFTIRPPTPSSYGGGEQSPMFSGGLAGAEHLQGGWDPSGASSWDALAHAPANVPVPDTQPKPMPRLMVHQGRQQPPQPVPTPAPAFYSPFAASAMQPDPQAARRDQQYRQQQPQAMQSDQLRDLEAADAAAHFELASQRSGSGHMQQPPQQQHSSVPPTPDVSSMTISAGRQSSGPLRTLHAQSPENAAAPPYQGGAATSDWVPDAGVEDVGGSKARQSGSNRSVLTLEAELSTLQRSMLGAWQPQQASPWQQPSLDSQIGGWEAALQGLEARAPPPPAMSRQRSGAMATEEESGQSGGRSLPQAFSVTAFSPDWDTTAGGSKLLLTGSLLPGAPSEAHSGPLFLLFDQTKVQAEVLQRGVLRATVPPHAPGQVRLAVTLRDGIPRSRLLTFDYRLPSPAQQSDDDRLELQLSDKALQLHLIRMLLDGRAPSTSGASPDGTPAPSDGAGGSNQQQQQQLSASQTSAAVQSELGDEQRSRFLTLLLHREVKRHTAQAQEATARGEDGCALDRLSTSGYGLLHLFAALGYAWGVRALLLAGSGANTRDAWGRTALHWAAARGHEEVLSVLLSHKAEPSLLTWALNNRPPVTAADLAAANGHTGIAAFLAEALLNDLLLKLKPENRRDALAAAAAASADTGSSGDSHGHKRTRQARSLYPGEEAASHIADLQPQERAAKAAAALTTAYSKVQQRKAIRHEHRSHQRQRELAAVARIEQWANTWQTAEGLTQNASQLAVERFRQLVTRATHVSATVRAVLVDGAADTDDEAVDTGSTSASRVDISGSSDYQQSLNAAVAHVAALEGSQAAEEQYQRLAAAKEADTDLPHKFLRPAVGASQQALQGGGNSDIQPDVQPQQLRVL